MELTGLRMSGIIRWTGWILRGLKYDEGPADQAYKDGIKYRKLVTSQKGKDFIKSYEGFREKPYKPFPNSKPTIGYGHEIKEGEHFTKITEDEALELFQKDIQYLNRSNLTIHNTNCIIP